MRILYTLINFFLMPKPSNNTITSSYTTTSSSFGTTTSQSFSAIRSRVQVAQPVSAYTAGWKRLDPLAKSAPRAYSTNVTKTSQGGYSYSHRVIYKVDPSYLEQNTSDGCYPQEIVVQRESAESALLNDSDYKAKAKLFEALKGQGANLANMLGERKQVANSISNLLRTVAYTARDLRRGNITSAIRRMGGDPKTARSLQKKDIANQWLSLQYGWKPLLSDVYDLVQGLHHREAFRVTVVRASASAMKVGVSTHSAFNHPETGKPTGLRSSRATTKYMLRVRPNISIAEPAALGFTNPLTVLWEVTPWSFVVDWALPIGRYLEQLSATHGWYFYDGCISQLCNIGEAGGYSWSRTVENNSQIVIDRQSHVGSSSAFFEFSRGLLSNFPIPDVPQFKNPFSAGHALNAIALLSQAFGRGKVYR